MLGDRSTVVVAIIADEREPRERKGRGREAVAGNRDGEWRVRLGLDFANTPLASCRCPHFGLEHNSPSS